MISEEEKLKQQLIEFYQLQLHKQGGYFKQTYRSPLIYNISNGNRSAMTVIYYMLTKDQPYGKWHTNMSDIYHFYQAGGAIKYDTISEQGLHQQSVLGKNFKNNQKMQFLCKGKLLKSAMLLYGDFCLIGQAVAPGFEYQDMKMYEQQEIVKKYPLLQNIIVREKQILKNKNN